MHLCSYGLHYIINPHNLQNLLELIYIEIYMKKFPRKKILILLTAIVIILLIRFSPFNIFGVKMICFPTSFQEQKIYHKEIKTVKVKLFGIDCAENYF